MNQPHQVVGGAGGLPDGVTMCSWFAACDRLATSTVPHPVLGDVPVCDRCRERAEEPELQGDIPPSSPDYPRGDQ